ncbi:hypothetical protein PGT21_019667 [Puccinia graminis f. sp. tritici]|uniref:Uncharacterized protein n=1 Tax=Puccinia graminis f. sp. tritici TaxID=56615 RepID=A0A5B0QFK9_PUCGR|nr:hypothetical protein PGT21_019667 [Puccinia graminis f. sp. tritici]
MSNPNEASPTAPNPHSSQAQAGPQIDDSRFGREVVERESSFQFLKKHRESSY